LNETFRTRGSAEWAQALSAKRVPAAPVNTVADALDQPVSHLRRMVEELEHPFGQGMLKFLGNPFKYGASRPLSYPPKHGAHTRAVLESVCAYSAGKIDDLIARGVIMQGDYHDKAE